MPLDPSAKNTIEWEDALADATIMVDLQEKYIIERLESIRKEGRGRRMASKDQNLTICEKELQATLTPDPVVFLRRSLAKKSMGVMLSNGFEEFIPSLAPILACDFDLE